MSEQMVRRSANMARIRGVDTGPELMLRRALWRAGFRYRLHSRIEGARPDIVFAGRKLVVFVDGCFWHGCPLHYVNPRSSDSFWAAKLAVNTSRDRIQTSRLLANGWCVLRFWEHEIETHLDKVVSEVTAAFRQPSQHFASREMVVKVESLGVGPTGVEERWFIEDLLDASSSRCEARMRGVAKSGKGFSPAKPPAGSP